VSLRDVVIPLRAARPMPARTDMAAAPPLPRFVQIEPVGQCNLRCTMCAVPFRPDGRDGALAFMRFDDFVAIVDQFPALESLHLQGLGEPLMHPRFFDMVAYAAGKGIAVSLNTNLTLLSARRAQACAASGLDAVHVSLDGASAAVYERIRVGARFDKVLRNLRRLVAARDAHGAGSPHIRLVAVLMRDNLAELPALVRLAADEGVGSLFVQRLAHDFREADLPPVYAPMRAFVDRQTIDREPRDRVEAVFDAARAAARERAIDLRLPQLDPRPPDARRTGCDWPSTGAYLSYRGEAMPCCMVGTPDRMQFGNMARDGVASVWASAEFNAFREALASGDPPAVCKGCALYQGRF
jgi:MoaA/NifB/PqqE/SkfB family radical SAM enzyme